MLIKRRMITESVARRLLLHSFHIALFYPSSVDTAVYIQIYSKAGFCHVDFTLLFTLGCMWVRENCPTSF